MQIQRSVLLQCFSSEHPRVFSHHQQAGRCPSRFGVQRISGGHRRPVPSQRVQQCWVSPWLCRPCLAPGLCWGTAAAHTCLHGRLGAPGPARGHELCLGRRTKPALHLPTDPRRLPPWSIYHFSKAASHGDKPNRNSCEAGRARWVRHILPI